LDLVPKAQKFSLPPLLVEKAVEAARIIKEAQALSLKPL
jgi:hypothetical protein